MSAERKFTSFFFLFFFLSIFFGMQITEAATGAIVQNVSISSATENTKTLEGSFIVSSFNGEKAQFRYEVKIFPGSITSADIVKSYADKKPIVPINSITGTTSPLDLHERRQVDFSLPFSESITEKEFTLSIIVSHASTGAFAGSFLLPLSQLIKNDSPAELDLVDDGTVAEQNRGIMAMGLLVGIIVLMAGGFLWRSKQKLFLFILCILSFSITLFGFGDVHEASAQTFTPTLTIVEQVGPPGATPTFRHHLFGSPNTNYSSPTIEVVSPPNVPGEPSLTWRHTTFGVEFSVCDPAGTCENVPCAQEGCWNGVDFYDTININSYLTDSNGNNRIDLTSVFNDGVAGLAWYTGDIDIITPLPFNSGRVYLTFNGTRNGQVFRLTAYFPVQIVNIDRTIIAQYNDNSPWNPNSGTGMPSNTAATSYCTGEGDFCQVCFTGPGDEITCTTGVGQGRCATGKNWYTQDLVRFTIPDASRVVRGYALMLGGERLNCNLNSTPVIGIDRGGSCGWSDYAYLSPSSFVNGTNTFVCSVQGKGDDDHRGLRLSTFYYDTLMEVGQPDLSVNAVNSSGNLTSGSTLTFSGTIANSGTNTTGASSVARFRVDGVTLSSPTTPTLLQGESTGVNSASWVAIAGTHIVELCADVDNTISEISETNNCLTQAIIISSPPPPPTPTTPTATCTAGSGTSASMAINWTAVTPVDYYQVRIDGNLVGGNRPTSPTSYTHTTLTQGTTHTATVSACNNSGVCRTSPPTALVNCPYPNLTASCSVAPTSATIGQSVTWTAIANGGAGTYNYSWTGSETLSGTTRTLAKTYTTVGAKTANVTVTSGSGAFTQSRTVACSNSVTVAGNADLRGFPDAPTAVFGTPYRFSGRVRNDIPPAGNSTAPAPVSSTATFRIDMNDDGDWTDAGDIADAGTFTVGTLAMNSGSGVQNSSRTWLPVAGVHRLYLCADTGNVINEGPTGGPGESNNCNFVRFTVAPSTLTVSCRPSPNTIELGATTPVQWIADPSTPPPSTGPGYGYWWNTDSSCSSSWTPTRGCSYTPTSLGQISMGVTIAPSDYYADCEPLTVVNSTTATPSLSPACSIFTQTDGSFRYSLVPGAVNAPGPYNSTWTITPSVGSVINRTVQGLYYPNDGTSLSFPAGTTINTSVTLTQRNAPFTSGSASCAAYTMPTTTGGNCGNGTRDLGEDCDGSEGGIGDATFCSASCTLLRCNNNNTCQPFKGETPLNCRDCCSDPTKCIERET